MESRRPARRIEAAVRELLRIEPSDAWARRELALALAKRAAARRPWVKRSKQSASSRATVTAFPSSATFICSLGNSRSPLAIPARVELSVDHGDALHALLNLARVDRDGKTKLAFIEQQLIQQSRSAGMACSHSWNWRVRFWLGSIVQSLRQAHAERPDLWHAWAALVSQLGHLNRLDEALAIAREQSERFPHLPRAWLDLAFVHQLRNEPARKSPRPNGL